MKKVTKIMMTVFLFISVLSSCGNKAGGEKVVLGDTGYKVYLKGTYVEEKSQVGSGENKKTALLKSKDGNTRILVNVMSGEEVSNFLNKDKVIDPETFKSQLKELGQNFNVEISDEFTTSKGRNFLKYSQKINDSTTVKAVAIIEKDKLIMISITSNSEDKADEAITNFEESFDDDKLF